MVRVTLQHLVWSVICLRDGQKQINSVDTLNLRQIFEIFRAKFFCFSALSNVSVGNLDATKDENISLKCEHQSSFLVSNGLLIFFNNVTAYRANTEKCLS